MTPNHTPRRLALGCLALALAALTPEARASTASNTTITNTVSVAYNDAGGVAQAPVTASASITILLVPSSPLLSSPAAVSVTQGQTATLTYTITGTANGPDTYQITSIATPTNMVAAVTPGLPADFSLGGTTLAADASPSDTTILVPYDGVAANASINGLVPGDTVVIGGNAYVIAANGIAKNAGANTAVITLDSAIAGAVVPAGSIVGEQTTFDVTIPSGVVDSGSSGSHSVSTTAASTTDAGESTTQNPATVVTVNRPVLGVTKLVSTDGGASFGAAGNAPPNTELIYKIVVTNGGASDADAVVITDALPLFLTYVANSAKTATSAATLYTDVAATSLTDNAGGYTVVGTSPTNLSYAAGTVSAGANNTLVLFYKATIN
jgi:uncharacterized repeat protein (TIGR01451 family)